MPKYVANILGAVLILATLLCTAARPYAPKSADPVLEPWRWQEMNELSGQGVLCVDEAQDGTLWFGCIGGLLRYDGMHAEWIPFGEELKSLVNLGRPRDLWAFSVLCMPDGSLLVFLDSALVRWDNGEWSMIQDDLGYAGYEAQLVRADDGTIWLFNSSSLQHFNEDLSQQHVAIQASKGQWLSAFCLDENGDAWIVKNRPEAGSILIHIPLKNGRVLKEMLWSSHPIPCEVSGGEASICADQTGKIWYVDNQLKNEVLLFDPGSGVWESITHIEEKKGYYSLMKDRNNKLWAGSLGSIFALQESESTYYSSEKLGLPSVPLSIFEAENGLWWVILRGGHVYRMDLSDRQWWTYVNLHFECEEADGKLWFRTKKNQAVLHDPGTGQWIEYTQRNGVIDSLRSLHCSSHGLIWAVGRHEGRAALSVFDGNEWRLFRHADFALMIGEDSVFEAADGTMWFGAAGEQLRESEKEGGALQYEVISGKPHLLEHHTSSTLPYAIARFAQTSNGTLWLGSPNVYSYKPDAVKQGTLISQLPGVYTFDLVTDENGDVWVAKGMFGIYRNIDGNWKHYGKQEGLNGSFFADLLSLQDGTMLAASDQGISRFDGKTWSDPVFSKDFGIASRDGSMRKSNDGSVWFNYTSKDSRSPHVAMNLARDQRFCTVRYIANTDPPDTLIEEHPDKVDSSGNIYISWSGSDPWANTRADQICYSWRLNGGDWSLFTRQPGWTFLGLKSGTYTLEVRARDRDFNVDQSPAKSLFVVALPVWQRGWFIAMILSLIGAIVSIIWLFIFFHEKRLKDRAEHLMEIDQMKTGFFTNISHELRTPLTLISRPLERLLETEENDGKREMLSMSLRNANRVWGLATQLLDFRKLEQGKMEVELSKGDIAQCVCEVIEILRPAALSKHIDCKLKLPEECIGWFDAEMMKKIVQNLVNNAINYTPVKGEVRVVLNKSKDEGGREILLLVVEDTGPGIESVHQQRIFDRFYRIPEKSIVDGSGIGLNLTKELVELQGGTILIDSPIQPNNVNPGTRFTVCLPVGRDEYFKRSAELT